MKSNGVEYVIAFYTQFFSAAFRERYKDNIINPHPSLLPAFKGLRPFQDAIDYGSKIIGTTIEFPRERWDEGAIVAQTACPVDDKLDLRQTRHRVFVQQCKSIVQVLKWMADDRVVVQGERIVKIRGARYGSFEYSPELDFEELLDWEIPLPSQ
jgi:phosphoribosylglycinamide formyltransferase-1